MTTMRLRKVKDIWDCETCMYEMCDLTDEIVICEYGDVCMNDATTSDDEVESFAIEKVINCMKCDYECDVECFYDKDNKVSNIFGYGNYILMQVVRPHNGNDFKWLLWVTSTRAFDKWSNSTAHSVSFNTSFELWSHLMLNKAEIFKDVVSYLSDCYDVDAI